jgi:hypothetical protein
MPGALHENSIRELSQRIRSGGLSPIDVVGHSWRESMRSAEAERFHHRDGR